MLDRVRSWFTKDAEEAEPAPKTPCVGRHEAVRKINARKWTCDACGAVGYKHV